jgi:hypothetical protein
MMWGNSLVVMENKNIQTLGESSITRKSDP